MVILEICNRGGAPHNETQSGMGRVKIHKVRGINSPNNIPRVSFPFYLSSALVKDEREVLLEMTDLTYISR